MENYQAFMLPAHLPLFPLARAVLFPRTFLPLHIFEARYQELTRDILATHHHLLLALALDAEATEPLAEEAAFHPIGTLSRIVRAEPLVDGRWNLLLQGVQAVRITEIPKGSSYRLGRYETFPFESGSPWTGVDRDGFFQVLDAYGEQFRVQPQIRDLLALGLDEDVLLFTLGQALEFEPIERQFLLESDSLVTLASRLQDLMRFSSANRSLPEFR
jgi:Lon protease-like protein